MPPWLIKGVNRIVFGIVLSPCAKIGRDVLISYQVLGTVIHKRAVIGDRVVIATGITIGGRSGSSDVPVNAEGALIGANAIVPDDVSDSAVVVGVPARVKRINRPDQFPRYDVSMNEARH